jgi:hypothetical protein
MSGHGAVVVVVATGCVGGEVDVVSPGAGSTYVGSAGTRVVAGTVAGGIVVSGTVVSVAVDTLKVAVAPDSVDAVCSVAAALTVRRSRFPPSLLVVAKISATAARTARPADTKRRWRRTLWPRATFSRMTSGGETSAGVSGAPSVVIDDEE